MSTVTINNKEYELKFTFNSFKYMQDLDLSSLEEMEKKPFMIAPLIETLLMGAVNHNAKMKVKEEDIVAYLDEFVAGDENSLVDFLEELISLLQTSSFFKSLQKK